MVFQFYIWFFLYVLFAEFIKFMINKPFLSCLSIYGIFFFNFLLRMEIRTIYISFWEYLKHGIEIGSKLDCFKSNDKYKDRKCFEYVQQQRKPSICTFNSSYVFGFSIVWFFTFVLWFILMKWKKKEKRSYSILQPTNLAFTVLSIIQTVNTERFLGRRGLLLIDNYNYMNAWFR